MPKAGMRSVRAVEIVSYGPTSEIIPLGGGGNLNLNVPYQLRTSSNQGLWERLQH